jgi:hypothetical protein
MLDDQKPPQYMTSQELEDAIRKHREYAKRLIVEAKLRRTEAEKARLRLAESLQKDQ